MTAAITMLVLTLIALVLAVGALLEHLRSERAHRLAHHDAVRRVWAALLETRQRRP